VPTSDPVASCWNNEYRVLMPLIYRRPRKVHLQFKCFQHRLSQAPVLGGEATAPGV